jgi:hypothetical protein
VQGKRDDALGSSTIQHSQPVNDGGVKEQLACCPGPLKTDPLDKPGELMVRKGNDDQLASLDDVYRVRKKNTREDCLDPVSRIIGGGGDSHHRVTCSAEC